MASALRSRSCHLPEAVMRACCRCEYGIFGNPTSIRVAITNVVVSSRRYTTIIDHQERPQRRVPPATARFAAQAHRNRLGYRWSAPIQTQQSFAASTITAPTSSIASSTPSSTADSPSASSATRSLSEGLNDSPFTVDETGQQVDWTRSFHGLSAQPFGKEAADVLLRPIPLEDIEIKPDGILYLPEIKYRRILNQAFGPGGWGLAPRGETIVTDKSVTREYALVAHGRYETLPGVTSTPDHC